MKRQHLLCHHPQTLTADWPGGWEWVLPSQRPDPGALSVSSFSPQRQRVRAGGVPASPPGPLSSLPASDVPDCTGGPSPPLHPGTWTRISAAPGPAPALSACGRGSDRPPTWSPCGLAPSPPRSSWPHSGLLAWSADNPLPFHWAARLAQARLLTWAPHIPATPDLSARRHLGPRPAVSTGPSVQLIFTGLADQIQVR